MTNIFKRTEKSPSRPASQAESIINMESQNINNNINPQEEDYSDNYLSDNMVKTLQDPMGRLLLNLASTSRALSKKADIPNPNLDLEDISNNYQDYKEQQENRIQQEINEKKKQLDAMMEKLTINKTYTTMETIVAPSKFSPTDILINNEYKRAHAQNVFPKRQFNPRSTSSPSIAEHLTNLNEFQEDMLLSENEFKRFFQKSFTNEPYQFVFDQLSSKLPIADIYSNLLRRYDTRMNPYEAREKLLQYIPPANSTLSSIESDILELANRASLVHKESSRNSCFNVEIINAIKKALPRTCQEYVLKAEQECNGREASFAEFSTALKVYSDLIDLDLEKMYAGKPVKITNFNKYNTAKKAE